MPETSRIVVCNTTPLVGLFLLGRLELLRDLYGQVLVPPAVSEEFLAGPPQMIRSKALEEAIWVKTIHLRNPENVDWLADLDRGEAEVIVLAEEQRADLVIIDESLARRYARRRGLALTGTLGLLLRAKQDGLVEQLKPLLAHLRQSGFYLSDQLVEEALRLARE